MLRQASMSAPLRAADNLRPRPRVLALPRNAGPQGVRRAEGTRTFNPGVLGSSLRGPTTFRIAPNL